MPSNNEPVGGHTSWRTRLVHAWTTRGFMAAALWPASLLYRCLVATRRQMYRWGILNIHRVDPLVVVVGNVIAGGAGKTPTTIAIVQHLVQQNHAVGVISRGYGRSGDACLEVHDNDDPRSVGDEPLLIRGATQVPVFVARTRMAAVRALLAQYPQTQIVVCDDGLQHYALHRDIEVCVFDDRGCGNGWLLPAGPLREPWPRHVVHQAGQYADRLLVLHTGNRPAFAGFRAQRHLGVHAKRSDGTVIALTTLTTSGGPPLLALAGIAQPESFFSMLRALGIPLHKTIALPDHYDFNSTRPNIYEGYQLICTEKDAHKLWQLDPSAWAVPLVLTFEPEFFAALDTRVKEQLAAKLSLRHGHQTT